MLVVSSHHHLTYWPCFTGVRFVNEWNTSSPHYVLKCINCTNLLICLLLYRYTYHSVHCAQLQYHRWSYRHIAVASLAAAQLLSDKTRRCRFKYVIHSVLRSNKPFIHMGFNQSIDHRICIRRRKFKVSYDDDTEAPGCHGQTKDSLKKRSLQSAQKLMLRWRFSDCRWQTIPSRRRCRMPELR